jgi:hypothetical protein
VALKININSESSFSAHFQRPLGKKFYGSRGNRDPDFWKRWFRVSESGIFHDNDNISTNFTTGITNNTVNEG